MDNQSSSDNPMNTGNVMPPQNTPQAQPVTGFDEQRQWDDIQTALTTHEVTLKSRVEPATGTGGIASDSYQRRMRELRQKLYDGFIKKGLDHHVDQFMQQGVKSKNEALQKTLQQPVLLMQQAGRDKVFRDDLIKEVERRLDLMNDSPLQAAEEKLIALSSIYDHATSVDASQGGVTENWKKRVLRESRRRYALGLLTASPEEVQKWTQGTSDVAIYLKSLVEKVDQVEVQSPVPVEQPEATTPPPTSAIGASSTEQTEHVEKEEEPAPASPKPSFEMPQPSSVTRFPTLDTTAQQNEVVATPENGTASVIEAQPMEEQKEAEPESQQITQSSVPQFESVQHVGTVIPALDETSPKEEEKSQPHIPESQTSPISASTSPSSAPGQSFSDFLNSRSSQTPPLNPTPTPVQEQPQSSPFVRPQQELATPEVSHPENPTPFSPSSEMSSTPSQVEPVEKIEQPLGPPEKKKGFFGKLFGR